VVAHRISVDSSVAERQARSVTNGQAGVLELRTRFAVDDAELSRLHALAFDGSAQVQPWAARLARHALTWIGAFSHDQLIGFVQVCWDGGAHAFLLDTAVHPAHGRQGIGRRLVLTAAKEAKAAGCQWLHVDYEPHLCEFYLGACGFVPTEAGLLKLRN
jgi:ribosomal protein S18 acetylase RimI-like enzyme